MIMIKRTIVLSVLSLLIVVNSGNAADITWGAPTDISGPSDVSTTGTLVEAINAAADDITDTVVVNGVSFTSASLLPNNAGADIYLGTTGDDAYDQLLSNVDFGGGGDLFNLSAESRPLADGLLQSGSAYEVQVWFVDDRPAQDARVMQFGDGNGNTVLLNDQFAIGNFTADGASQELTLDAQDFGNAHITAYQVRAVPEPSSLASFGLAALLGLATATRRRRR